MAIDRAGARRRVRILTGWAAGGAAALTAAFAFGASRGGHVARANTRSDAGSASSAEQGALPQSADPQAPPSAYPQDPQAAQGFTPPSASTAPPAAMSGGS
jgi:hypothetical protein